MLRHDPPFNLFGKLRDDEYRRLAAALSPNWKDGEAAKVVEAFARRAAGDGEEVEIDSLCRWIRQHPDDAEAVVDCMSFVPPVGVSLVRRLSQVGSQKRVYLANWRLTQREIVLKRIIAAGDQRRRILDRESTSHPFSISHPNISRRTR